MSPDLISDVSHGVDVASRINELDVEEPLTVRRLLVLGSCIGAVTRPVPDGFTVIKIGLGGAVGLTTSGVWSVWEIERAEMQAELHNIKDAMLTDLSETKVERDKTSTQVVYGHDGQAIHAILAAEMYPDWRRSSIR